MKRSRENAENYIWGDNCLGWRLVDSPEVSIIEEEMPPDTQEVIHYHEKANQFFYILEGTAQFLIDGKEFCLQSKEGIFVKAGCIHNISNRTNSLLKFLVISNPITRNDRVVPKISGKSRI